MSVHRLAKYQSDDPFTRVPNTAVNDDRLDLKARGLLLLMLSLPDHWVFRERNLADKAGVGREQVRTAMAKLIETGYVIRRREATDGKPPVVVTEVYDTAQVQDAAKVGNPEVGKPDRRESRPISNKPPRETKETSKRPSAMTDDWQPDSTNLDRIRAKHPTLDLIAELDNFRDHYISKGEKRADWNASLRTWCRNAEKWAKPKGFSSAGQYVAGSGGVYQ
jgi:hypothetical protein